MAQIASRAWPKLREDLTLYPGPTDPSGSPTWTLHDPARNQYIAIDWITFEIISRLGEGNIENIFAAVVKHTTLAIDEEDIKKVLTFLDENELIQRHNSIENHVLSQHQGRLKQSWSQMLLHGYLFFRIPLLKPDKWLSFILPYFNFVFKPNFLKITLLVFLFGLLGVYQQWETFKTTLVDTFSLSGFVSYGFTLIVIKIIHELGHALVAKRNGCRVPTMGVAFLVMWPVAYTDVTESWKLNTHRKRLQIAGAGIATELVLAAWALLCWVIFPENGMRDIFFFISTTSLITTLAINASPFMRFDGYFLLCDFLGMPNLHGRSFAFAKWWLRKKFLLLDRDPPEVISLGRQNFMIAFALITLIYRLIVFTGIAVLVYHYFFKALGIILFCIEIWFFVMRPIWHEFMFWHKEIKSSNTEVEENLPPIWKILFWVVIFLFIPFDITVNTEGILKAEKSFNVVTFAPTQIVEMPASIGSSIKEGTPLLELNSPELDEKINVTKNKVQTLNRQLNASGFDHEILQQQALLKEQLKSADEELGGFIAEKTRLKPVAPFSGTLVDVDPDLFKSEWIPKGVNILSLIDQRSWIVDCYISETDLKRIDVNHIGWFIPEAAGLSNLKLSVISIDRDASKTINDGALTSLAGGEVLVRMQNNKFIPEHAVYRVRLKADHLSEKMSSGYLRGRVVMLGWPKSIIGDIFRNSIATVIRELGF
jgi:putative peptide zinc metalloprotease protein